MFLLLSSLLCAKPVLSLERLRDVLYQYYPDQVVQYADDLGEGKGAFDPDPRIDFSKVNCTTWWQQVIAKGYAATPKEELEVLDRIRYYDGAIGFATRKHFLDRALLLDPVPFENIEEAKISGCKADVRRDVVLQLSHFTQSHRFACSLYRADVEEIRFAYFSPNALLQCLDNLSDGVYMIFPVASRQYNEIWGKKSGPMGRVHGLILDKEVGVAQVYHASIDKNKVQRLPAQSYIESLAAVNFDGYQLYRLHSQLAQPVYSESHKQALRCEDETYRGNIIQR